MKENGHLPCLPIQTKAVKTLFTGRLPFMKHKIICRRRYFGRDLNQPVQLDARGEPGMQYTWTPSIGLNRTDIEKPVATYDRDQLHKLYTVSPQGCEKHSDIFIKRWAGPELFVPNAFTPDNDGVNDKLKVKPTGLQVVWLLWRYITGGDN